MEISKYKMGNFNHSIFPPQKIAEEKIIVENHKHFYRKMKIFQSPKIDDSIIIVVLKSNQLS